MGAMCACTGRHTQQRQVCAHAVQPWAKTSNARRMRQTTQRPQLQKTMQQQYRDALLKVLLYMAVFLSKLLFYAPTDALNA